MLIHFAEERGNQLKGQREEELFIVRPSRRNDSCDEVSSRWTRRFNKIPRAARSAICKLKVSSLLFFTLFSLLYRLRTARGKKISRPRFFIKSKRSFGPSITQTCIYYYFLFSYFVAFTLLLIAHLNAFMPRTKTLERKQQKHSSLKTWLISSEKRNSTTPFTDFRSDLSLKTVKKTLPWLCAWIMGSTYLFLATSCDIIANQEVEEIKRERANVSLLSWSSASSFRLLFPTPSRNSKFLWLSPIFNVNIPKRGKKKVVVVADPCKPGLNYRLMPVDKTALPRLTYFGSPLPPPPIFFPPFRSFKSYQRVLARGLSLWD